MVLHDVALVTWSVGCLAIGVVIGLWVRHFIVRLRGGTLRVDRSPDPPLPQDDPDPPGVPGVPPTP